MSERIHGELRKRQYYYTFGLTPSRASELPSTEWYVVPILINDPSVCLYPFQCLVVRVLKVTIGLFVVSVECWIGSTQGVDVLQSNSTQVEECGVGVISG